MPTVDDELTRRLQRAQRPIDGDGQFEQIMRRRQRFEVARKAQIGALAVAVLALTAGGFVALTSTFGDPPAPIGTSPHPILPKENGLLALADGSSLFTIPPDGGEASRVGGIPEGAWSPAWSPDGTRLAVAIFPLGPGPRELWVVDADGSDATKLVEAENVSRPSWSPDGSVIAYVADDDEGSAIHVIGADGTDDRVVGEVLHGPDYFSAAFSPDGTQILFDKGTDVGFAIFVMAADGTQSTRLSAGDRDYNPSWSPDGTEIAFTRQEDSMESDIFVMEADGTGVRRVTDGQPGDTNLGPVWAPDGTQIAYQSGRTGGPGGLVLTRPDGSDPHEIVQDGVLGIAWQPLPIDKSAVPERDGEDIGLGVRMCHLEVLDSIDWDGTGVDGAAWTGAPVDEDGRCSSPAGVQHIVAVDRDGDGIAEQGSTSTLRSCLLCGPFDTVDLNDDGVLELVVLEEASSTPTYSVYEVNRPGSERSPGVYPIIVVAPGAPAMNLDKSEPVRFTVGGDEGFSGSIECEETGAGAPILRYTWVRGAVDADTELRVNITRLRFGEDGVFHIESIDRFSVPRDPEPTDLKSTEPACGVDFHPAA
jgi:TolB protein